MQAAAPHLDRQGAGSDSALLILPVVDVERRADLMGGKSTPELQGNLAVLGTASEFQDFARVAILEAEVRGRSASHSPERLEDA